MKLVVRMSVLALVVIFVSGAHFGSKDGTGVYLLPDKKMEIRARNLTDSYYKAFQWAVLDYAFNTDLNTHLSRGKCHSQYHRICLFEGDYGNSGWAGNYECQRGVRGAHPRKTCDFSYVRVNSYYRGDIKEIKVACHELGHAVGLRHRPSGDLSSCMKQGYPAKNTLDGHDRARINAHY